MSFKNLGKVSDTLKSAEKVLANTGNALLSKSVLKEGLKGFDVETLVTSLSTLGKDKQGVLDILDIIDIDIDADEVSEKISKAFKSIEADGLDLTGILSKAWTGLKTTMMGVFGFLAANPTILLGIAAAAALAATNIITYNNSFDKLLENAKESGDAYSQAKAELEQYEKELSETNSRIKELE